MFAGMYWLVLRDIITLNGSSTSAARSSTQQVEPDKVRITIHTHPATRRHFSLRGTFLSPRVLGVFMWHSYGHFYWTQNISVKKSMRCLAPALAAIKGQGIIETSKFSLSLHSVAIHASLLTASQE